MPIWMFFAAAAASFLLTTAMAIRRIKNAKPATASEFNVPTAEEGRAIPVLFGTRRLTSPNVVWYGDLKIVAITDEVGL